MRIIINLFKLLLVIKQGCGVKVGAADFPTNV
jgi:hypothetical protein